MFQEMAHKAKSQSSLRLRILSFVGALVVLSLLGSTLSLYRITEVNRLLDAMNRVSVPLGRLFTQVQSDAELLGREAERAMGISHWKEPQWKPRPVPRWMGEVLESEVSRLQELLRTEVGWASPAARERWREWGANIAAGLGKLRVDSGKLYAALEQKDLAEAEAIHSRWIAGLEDWRRQLQWGSMEYDRVFRETFSLAQSRVSELRTGLEMILLTVVALSLLLLWLGERAIRPLGELTALAREITRRGLRKEDKSLLPEISLSRSDEVSQLAREFHHMATALLEREKMVESQKRRAMEQNRLLRELGELNTNVLNSIESILIVTDLEGKITQANPVAVRFLGVSSGVAEGLDEETMGQIIGTSLSSWPKLQLFLKHFPQAERIEPAALDGRSYGGRILPLRGEDGSERGFILVLDDLTEELDLQERLRTAENLAAVGRMSAQVAHEVRNPLHSIGLEAEVAVEMAARSGDPALKQSLQSILGSVDRLEKITENYLKLSRLSAGNKEAFDLGETLESVLATYAPACEAQGVEVDWRREPNSHLKVYGDRDLLEQVMGNLFRNALQALEELSGPKRIEWRLGSTEAGSVFATIQDNGPGIPEEIEHRLFTPFLTTRAQGTGLGLSFVKKVLEEHGGSIRYLPAHSRTGPSNGQLSGGAVFEILLPQYLESSVAREAAARLPERATPSIEMG